MLAESTNLSAILKLNESYNSSNRKPSPIKSNKIARSKSEKHTGIKKKPQDGLNDWKYSKPDNLEDRLPQPFRFINRIIYKDILLRKVFMAIEEIEKSKKSHNYEARVREVNPVSFFEIDGTSALCYPRFNPVNVLITGDKYGNINILDLNRRIQLLKREVSQAHRIVALDAIMIEYGGDYMVTIAVITRGENVIQIWRVRTRDYNPVLAARIQTPQGLSGPFTPQTKIDEFPWKLKFSDDDLFLAVTLYNGSVEVYQIPEPPAIQPIVEEPELASSGSLNNLKSVNPSSFSPVMVNSGSKLSPSKTEGSPRKTTYVQPNLSDVPTKDLSLFKKIPLRGPENKINAEQAIIQALLGNSAADEQKMPPPIKDEKGKKAPKKDTKKEEPKQAEGQEKSLFQLPTPTFEVNPELFMGETVTNSSFDTNPDPQAPKYYPDFFFNNVTISFQPENSRSLGKEITTTITTGITCAWHETCTVETFELQLPIPENAPTYFSFKNKFYLHNQLNRRNKKAAQPEKIATVVFPTEVKESSPPKKEEKKESKKEGKKEQKKEVKKEGKKEAVPKPIENAPKEKDKPVVSPTENSNLVLKPSKKIETIYPIKTAAISKMKGFLALGLADGSLLILDTIEYSQRYLLDKHLGPVTTISFLDEWRLMSGSADGGVHLHQIMETASDELQCKKYQHVFRTLGNSITDVQISEVGLGFVIDKQGSARCYDLHHFEKIMKLNTKSSYAKACKFSLWPRPLISTGNEQFVAVCDVIESEFSDKETNNFNSWEKNTLILLYRTYETLTELFPGFANLAKKGIERTKVMNAFAKISFKDLKDPKYEIPQFKTEHPGVQSSDKKAEKSQTEPLKSQRSVKIGNSKSTIFTIKTLALSPLKRNKSRGNLSQTERQEHKLTQEALHPEQYYFSGNSQPGPLFADSLKNTLTGARAIISDKVNRTERLQNYYVFVKEDLQLREHELILRKRQQQILKEIRKYK